MTTASIRAKLAARGIDHEPPFGCMECGDEQHHHGHQWAPIVGMHQWMEPTQAMILERMRRRRANRPAVPSTPQERMLAVHADAYTSWPDGDPICATCHRIDCPRYWRIQNRLDSEEAARRAALPPNPYGDEPW